MTIHAVQELSSINDPDLIRICVCVQDMRRILTALFKHVVSQLTRHPVTAPIRVPLAIVDRLAEGALSVELLCQKNRVRDAAIILLSLHELRLDLQYIALDLERADIWLDHAQDRGKKPWRVASQMNEMYIRPDELKAERWLQSCTLRFELFHRAALLVRPGGKTRLRMTDNLPTRQTFTRIANALASG